MARRHLSRKQKTILVMYWLIQIRTMMLLNICFFMVLALECLKQEKKKRKSLRFRITFEKSWKNLKKFLDSDSSCIEHLRMDRNTFHTLCGMLRTIGNLSDTKNMVVEERVAIFLHILAHHVKNRKIKRMFKRSQETISRHFHKVLRAVLRLHGILLKTSEPVPENSTDVRWKWFPNCLGALDGTYIRVKISDFEKPRYRTTKGELATNVLAVCSQDMQFIYVLPGWEGSAADGRILQDAVSRRHPFKVPHGCYYLVDAGYANGEGFLAPYSGRPYQLIEWTNGCLPANPEELFNMKHSAARNVIDRCFGLLKMRWAILQSRCFYGVDAHANIITACCLLHNLIRREMQIDPMESLLDAEMMQSNVSEEYNNTLQLQVDDCIIDGVETGSGEWVAFRDNLARKMYDSWTANPDRLVDSRDLGTGCGNAREEETGTMNLLGR